MNEDITCPLCLKPNTISVEYAALGYYHAVCLTCADEFAPMGVAKSPVAAKLDLLEQLLEELPYHEDNMQETANTSNYEHLHLELQREPDGYRYVWSCKYDPEDIWDTGFVLTRDAGEADYVAHEQFGRALAATKGEYRPFRFPPLKKKKPAIVEKKEVPCQIQEDTI